MEEAHAKTSNDSEHGERDGLRLVEVRDVEERPVLGDEDERVEVRLREVERDLRVPDAVNYGELEDGKTGPGRTKSMKPIHAAMTTVRFVR